MRSCQSCAPTIVAAVLTLCTTLAANGPDAVGGGYTHNGIVGEYFTTPDLSGSPAFTRCDVRIDFDWGELRSAGGSTYEPYRTYPLDNYSVRWTGQIVARFTESYVFIAEADDGIRVQLREEGAGTWNTIIDQWSGAGAGASTPQPLSAGQRYDIQVEYRELSGPAICRLMWQSQNTPREVIEPVLPQALNIASWAEYIWANHTKRRRFWKEGDNGLDENGWPLGDNAEFILGEMSGSDPDLQGTYLMTFTGKARVSAACCFSPAFYVNDSLIGSVLPAGTGYDPATNTTTATMTTTSSRMFIRFTETSRDGNTSGTGFTDLQFMRPVTMGDSLHHNAGEIVYRPMKAVGGENYTCFRYLGIANNESTPDWPSRTRPDHQKFSDGSGGENWEHMIMLCNETGKDLYISTPVNADDDYLLKLAQLLKYGSNGDLPYTAPQASPEYPPLNPNLRVYLEIGNEIWNWSFKSTQIAQQQCQAEARANSSLWADTINYDGAAGNPGWIKAVRRWHIARTVAASKLFRQAWGDAGMGSRIRVLVEYQYDNKQSSASHSFEFLEGFYNNGRGDYVDDPRPASYHVWGGGGATYYGVGNILGTQSATLVPDSSFETPAIGDNTLQVRPSGSPWTFTGEAGVYRQTGTTAIGNIGTPVAASDGNQAAFIVDTGSISCTVDFAHTGRFALLFRAAYIQNRANYFKIYVDDINISPEGQTDIRISDSRTGLGGWSRSTTNFSQQWGSAVFEITTPGNHTIRFVGTQTDGDVVTLDHIAVASVDSLLGSGFGSGQALGQAADSSYSERCNVQAIYTRTFGLQTVAYEAGWSVGGDFTQIPIQNWCKLMEDRARLINHDAIDFFDRSGSHMNVWGVYTYWPSWDFANANDYPIMRSFLESTLQPREEPNYGKAVPGTVIGDEDLSWRGGATGNELTDRGQWASWMIVTLERAVYEFVMHARETGSYLIEVDGTAIGTGTDASVAADTTFEIELVKGAHAIRIQSTLGAVTVDSVVVTSKPVSVRRTDNVAMPSETPATERGLVALGWDADLPPYAATPDEGPTAVSHGAADRHPAAQPEAALSPAEPTASAVAIARCSPASPAVAETPDHQDDIRPTNTRGDNLEPATSPADTYDAADMSWSSQRPCVPVHGVHTSSAHGSNDATHTIDRDLRTRWTPGSDKAWITYDLGSPKSIDAATLVWYALRRTRTPCCVEMSVDGECYETAWEGSLRGRGTTTERITLSTRPARYLRVVVGKAGESPVSLYEVGIHGPSGLASSEATGE